MAVWNKISVYVLIAAGWMAVSYAIPFFFDLDTVNAMAEEDALQENITAVCFFLAGVLFLFRFFRDAHGNDFFIAKTRRNICYLMLGILFLFGAGEEISWGQRIFHVATPEAVRKLNTQDELNFHNLVIFQGERRGGADVAAAREGRISMDKLFSLFWLSFCILLPLLAKLNGRFRNQMQRINIPLVPLSLGLLFLVNYALSKVMPSLYAMDIGRYVVETKESLFAWLFFLIALWLALRIRGTADAA